MPGADNDSIFGGEMLRDCVEEINLLIYTDEFGTVARHMERMVVR